MYLSHWGMKAWAAEEEPRPKPRPNAMATMVAFRPVKGSLVIRLMPEITMLANMNTAAPPKTGWGMMLMMAPILGNRPASTRMAAPMAMAKRLTTLVMPTRPTFWLKEVLGSTPNRAATAEPKPSQTTAPDSSLSVGARSRPPSTTPEVSPMVSTAVTMNMMHMGMMASSLKRMLVKISLGGRGRANHLAAPTCSHLVM